MPPARVCSSGMKTKRHRRTAAVAVWLSLSTFAAVASGESPPSAVAAPEEPTPLRIVFVDVGHGDCVWITTPDDGIPGNGVCEGYDIVIDGGPSSQRIVPLLTEAGLKPGAEIEWMICTHAHNDHYRGLIGVLDEYRVRNIVEPGFRSRGQAFSAFCWLSLVEPASVFYSPAVGIPAIPGLRSLSPSVPCPLDWGGELDAVILHSNPAVSEGNENLSSIVLRLRYGDFSILFTGDEEGKYRDGPASSASLVEAFLLDRYCREGENGLAATVVKVPHHGSETSSTVPFIEAVGAKEAVICAGNRYGLPDRSVVERYRSAGCRVWSTDRGDRGRPASDCHGDDIVISSDGRSYEIRYLNPDPGGVLPVPPTAAAAGF